MRTFGLFIFLTFSSVFALARTVKYELSANQQTMNISGKQSVDFALSINGQIPAPTLNFTEGDEAEITVQNNLQKENLSIHWHGILLPPEMDGVPYVNTPPIAPGKSFTFKFTLRQSGTYWYHSHTKLQEQKGVYGAFIIQPKKAKIKVDYDIPVILSDWTDENADQVLNNLRKDGDYYLYKKGTMRSWLGAIQQGNGALGRFLYNEWTRMGGMDLSDVGYDAFLINGKRDSQIVSAHPGKKIRLRIINAAASSYFFISLADLPLKIISADGVDIKPINSKEVLIGMAETYDVLFTVPDHKNYEFRATAQDGTGWASAWIGMGKKVLSPTKPLPDQYATMEHSGYTGAATHDNHASPENNSPRNQHQGHQLNQLPAQDSSNHSHHQHKIMSDTNQNQIRDSMESILPTMTVDDTQSEISTEFESKKANYDVKLVLGGDMTRYVWYINGKAIHQDRNIEIHENNIVRFTLVNETMMHHPMHLHGHFFRVLNKYGKNSPLKHTVDVPPHTTRTIEFLANEPGEWMLHCHNLYHLKTGMARVVKYSSFTPKPDIAVWQKHDPHLHDHWYNYGLIETSSNHAQAFLSLSQTWNQFETRIESANIRNKQFSFDNKWDYEVDLFYRRWVNRFFNMVAGGTSYGEQENAVIGIGYILPFLIRTNVLISNSAKLRIDIDKRFQWAKSIFSEIEFSYRPNQNGAHEFETEVSLMYAPKWSWSAGLMLTNDSLGAGLEYQF